LVLEFAEVLGLKSAPLFDENQIDSGFDATSSPLSSKEIQDARRLAMQLREEEKAVKIAEMQRKEEARLEKQRANEISPSPLQKDTDFKNELTERERRKEEQFEEIRKAQQEKMNLHKKSPTEIIAFKSFSPGSISIFLSFII
jgi:hypothetical protein